MKRIFVYLSLAASLILASCNLPVSSSPNPEMMTSAAQTVQAAINSAPLASPTNDQIVPAGTDASFSPPYITVEDVTNCRTGPGVNYERVTQIAPGEKVDVIGVFPPSYWIVSSKSGICWISVDFSTPGGSVQVVPTVTAPPTPTGSPPVGVGFQKWNIDCNYVSNQATVLLIWSDKADNETGYRVYRNGGVVAELPANSTQFTEVITLLAGQSAGYKVEVFSPAGSASSKTISLAC